MVLGTPLTLWGRNQVQIPHSIQRILVQIPQIERGESLGAFLLRAKIRIDHDLDLINASGSRGLHFCDWQLGDSGRWFLRTVSISNADKVEGGLIRNLELESIVGIRVYRRVTIPNEIDWEQMTTAFPYPQAHKLYIQEAESGPRD